jgi:hypothetical protein
MSKKKLKREATFSVIHKGLRLQIQVLRSVWDVHAAYKGNSKPTRKGTISHAFFEQFQPGSKHFGRIVLPLTGRLSELVPHEVAHAVIGYLGTVTATDDEFAATAIGALTAKISDALGLNVARRVLH